MPRPFSRRAARLRNRRRHTVLALVAVPAVIGAGVVVAPPLAAMLVEIDPVEEARQARVALESAMDARAATAAKGMTTSWFDAAGDLLATAVGGSFDRDDREAPTAAASYTAQGRLLASGASTRKYRSAPGSVCEIDGKRVGRGGTSVDLPGSGSVGFRCAATDADSAGLEVEQRGRFAPVGRAAMRPGPLDEAAPSGSDGTDGAGATRGRSAPSSVAPRGLGANAFADWERAGTDSDGDGIQNLWELDGYAVEQNKNGVLKVVKWDESVHADAHDPWGNRYVKYTSSPVKSSTNNDPYTDFEKVTNVGLLPGITAEARHPLVTAMPEVQIDMESFRLIKNEDWSSSSGGENRVGVTQTTSSGSSRSNTAGTSAECDFSIGVGRKLKWGCSLTANYSHTWGSTSEYTESKDNSTTDTWNELISGSTSKAAILLPSMRYKNTGTHPISDSEPKFTITLGDQELVSGIANAANNLGSANPEESYPAKGSPALAFQSINDFASPITLDQDVYRQMQYRHPGSPELRVVTNGFDGAVPMVDENGLPVPSVKTWAGVRNSVLATNATLIVEKPDGTTEKRLIAAKGTGHTEATVPSLTLGEALALTHGATQRGDDWYIGGNRIDPESYEFTMTDDTNERLAEQAIEDVFDLRLEAGMVVAIKEIAPPAEAEDWTITRGAPSGTNCVVPAYDERCQVTLNLPSHYGAKWGTEVKIRIDGRDLPVRRNSGSFWYFDESDVGGHAGWPTGTMLELFIDGESAGEKPLPEPLR